MIMCTYNAVRLFATMLIAVHLSFGCVASYGVDVATHPHHHAPATIHHIIYHSYCIYGLVGLAYTACYPPLLYLTFLHEFFRDSELDSELLYYEEMHDAGYLFDGRGGV